MGRIYLTNIDSGISGFKLATFGYPGWTASTTLSTAVTDTDGSTTLAMTATSGGTAIKWITPPFKNDVTVAGSVIFNFWGFEATAAANAAFGLTLAEYTTSQQSVFCTTSYGTELGTTTSQIQRSRQPAAVGTVDGGAYTATLIDAGNRLVIIPTIVAFGTMGTGPAVTMQYNGSTAGAAGDSYIVLTEAAEPSQSQFGANTPAVPNGPSAMSYGDAVRWLDPVIKAITPGANPEWQTLKDELNYQGNVGANDKIQSA